MVNYLPELIKYAKDIGIIDIFISTNGMLLTKKMSASLIDAGLTHLMVSLDAATPETYSNIRVGGNFDRVVKNILDFLSVRERMKSELPLLRVSFIKMQKNIHELDDFIHMWSEKSDYIAIVGYLNNINDTKTNNCLSINKPSGKKIEKYYCNQPWTRCTIFANGDVFPCCMNYGRSAPIGNIYNEKLSSIWYSEKMNFIQNIHKDGNYHLHPVCFKCISKRDIFTN